MKLTTLIVSAALAAGVAGCGLMKAAGVMKPAPRNEAVVLKSTGNWGDSKTIVIPTLYVRMPVDGKDSAVNDNNAFASDQGRAKVFVHYKVAGLDKALAQEIAKAAYDDLVAKVRAAGYTVLTYDDVKTQSFVAGLTRYERDAALGLPLDGGEVIATPTDDQAIKVGFAGDVLSPYKSFGKSRFADGTVIVPVLTLKAPLVGKETSSSSAHLTVIPGMALTQANTPMMTKKGGWGGAQLQKWVFGLSDNIGTVGHEVDNTSHAANALSTGLALLSGTSSINTKSKSFTVTIDRAAYKAGALKGLTSYNDELAKVIAAAKN